MPQAKEASDIDAFIVIVLPVIHGNIQKYWFLLDDDRYIPGEFAYLMGLIRDCVASILPPHLPYVPVIRGIELVFVPREQAGEQKKKD